MFEQVFQFISFIGAGQGLILSIVFLSGKNISLTRKLMGIFILFFSLGLLEPYMEANLTQYPFFKWTFTVLALGNFLYGPLIYLFVYYLVKSQRTFRSSHYLHFSPFALGLTLEIITVLIGGNSFFESDLAGFIAFEGLIIQILFYNILAIWLLRKYRNQPTQNENIHNSKDIQWLEFFLIFITCIYVLSFTISHLIIFGLEVNKFYLLVQLTITVGIYLLSYKSMLIPEVFNLKTGHSKNGMKKYERSGLKEEKAISYREQLTQYMNKEKPYRNPNITIDQVAKDMEISRHHLTQVINEHFNKNFYAFVNDYRVEEVKQMIMDDKFNHLNLSALGLEAGFKSKTAFNTNFKKVTGLTPSEWKNQHNKTSKIQL